MTTPHQEPTELSKAIERIEREIDSQEGSGDQFCQDLQKLLTAAKRTIRQQEVITELSEFVDLVHKHFQPDLVEPGRTIRTALVDAGAVVIVSEHIRQIIGEGDELGGPSDFKPIHFALVLMIGKAHFYTTET